MIKKEKPCSDFEVERYNDDLQRAITILKSSNLTETLELQAISTLAEIYHVCNSAMIELHSTDTITVKTAKDLSKKVTETMINIHLGKENSGEGKVGVMIGMGPKITGDISKELKRRADRISFSDEAMGFIDRTFAERLYPYVEDFSENFLSSPFIEKDFFNELNKFESITNELLKIIDKGENIPKMVLRKMGELFTKCNLYCGSIAHHPRYEKYSGFAMGMADLVYHSMYRFTKGIKNKDISELSPIFEEITYMKSLFPEEN